MCLVNLSNKHVVECNQFQFLLCLFKQDTINPVVIAMVDTAVTLFGGGGVCLHNKIQAEIKTSGHKCIVHGRRDKEEVKDEEEGGLCGVIDRGLRVVDCSKNQPQVIEDDHRVDVVSVTWR